MSPDEKNVIYVPKAHKWLMVKFGFNLVYENPRIWWCTFSSDSSS